MIMIKKMLVIDSNPNNILEVENYLSIIKSQVAAVEARYPDILISITEAVNNAIIHGNKADESKKVRINMQEQLQGLAVSISDEGAGFDPADVPDPTAPENIECCGGRGVLIMSTLADRLSYANNGSTVELFFKFG